MQLFLWLSMILISTSILFTYEWISLEYRWSCAWGRIYISTAKISSLPTNPSDEITLNIEKIIWDGANFFVTRLKLRWLFVCYIFLRLSVATKVFILIRNRGKSESLSTATRKLKFLDGFFQNVHLGICFSGLLMEFFLSWLCTVHSDLF